jgi:hypothetical protein
MPRDSDSLLRWVITATALGFAALAVLYAVIRTTASIAN